MTVNYSVKYGISIIQCSFSSTYLENVEIPCC